MTKRKISMTGHEKFIVDDKGKRVSVVLDIAEYEKLLDELADIRAYDEAKASGEKPIPWSEARKRLDPPGGVTYALSTLPRAEKVLAKLPKDARKRIVKAIDAIEKQPRSPGSKKLARRRP